MSASKSDGLSWQNAPDRSVKNPRFEIVRAPAKGSIAGICLSHEVCGILVHYNGSTKKPCRRVMCEACAKNADVRWYGYVWFRPEKSEVVTILEITALAGESFAEYFERRRTLRGSYWKLSRKNGKPGGPVRAQFKAPEGDTKTIPGMPDLANQMKIIWGIREEVELTGGPVIRDQIAAALASTNGHAD